MFFVCSRQPLNKFTRVSKGTNLAVAPMTQPMVTMDRPASGFIEDNKKVLKLSGVRD